MDDRRAKDGLKASEASSQPRKGVSEKEVEDEKATEDEDVGTNREEGANNLFDCPVCLQNCSYPVQLPCKHIFCFLCVKGAAHRSRRCAMCRQNIPADFFQDPKLVRPDDLHTSATQAFDDGYQWFYEGRNGWWQYDERTSNELETRFKKEDSSKVFELLIGGYLYVIDLENMVQCRRSNQSRQRRMRRDTRNIPGLKGIAGIRYNDSQASRPSGDGGETSSTSSNPNANNPPSSTGASTNPSTALPANNGGPNTAADPDVYPGPPAPNNTPQTSQTPAGSPPSSISNSDPDLSLHLQNLNLDDDNPPFLRETARSELHDPFDEDGIYNRDNSEEEEQEEEQESYPFETNC